MSFQQKKQALGVIETLLNSISEKSAESNTEPGSIGGSSSHPSAKVDDKTQDAPTGARYSENSSDNKAEPNRGDLSVEQSGDGGTQDSVQTNIGMTSKTTGEDPANETSSTKAVKEDSDTSHPARTDNSALDGRKYSSYEEKLAALLKQASELGSSIAASIAVEVEKQAAACAADTLEAGDKPTNAPKMAPEADPAAKQKEEGKSASEKKQPSEKEKLASVVGDDLADLFASAAVPAEDAIALKQASEEYLGQVVKAAEFRAQLAAEFLYAYAAEKKAMEEEEKEESKSEEKKEESSGKKSEPSSDSSDSSEGGATAPKSEPAAPAAAPAPEAAPPADPAMGGDAAPAGDMAGGLGEEDIMSLLGGGEDMGAGAAMDGMDQTDMGGAGAEMGGGDDMMVLEEALSQLGITPEQLQQLLGAGGGAGVEAGMGGEPKLASAKKQAKVNQKQAAFQRKVASTKTMIRELIGRSRG